MKGNYYTPEEIHYMDAGLVCVVDFGFRLLMAKALSRVPREVVDAFFEECVVLTIDPDELGSFISREVFEGRHVLLFPYELLGWSEDKQIGTILHETAHFALGHKSSIETSFDGYTERINSYKEYEVDAWALVRKWLKDYERRKR